MLKLTCEFDEVIDSREMYKELEVYGLNVLDVLQGVYVYGIIDTCHLNCVVFTLIKYGEPKITLYKSPS